MLVGPGEAPGATMIRKSPSENSDTDSVVFRKPTVGIIIMRNHNL